MDLYIYYQVAIGNADALHAQVASMQASMHDRAKVTGMLKRRPEAKDGLHTWMEIYLNTPAEFEALLHRTVVQSELPSLIVGKRHTEYFMDHTPCA